MTAKHGAPALDVELGGQAVQGMRRELRSAMNLVPADLRSISSSGGDLTAFDAS